MILVIDDDIAVRTSLMLLLKNEGFEAMSAENQAAAMKIVNEASPALIVLDLNFSIDTSGKEGMHLLSQIRAVSSAPVILLTGWGSIDLAVKGMKLGASDFQTKPWSNDHLMASVKTLLQLQGQKPEKNSREKLGSLYNFEQIIGEDPGMLDLLDTVGRVASTDASVLIMGESGTGKELIAEAIHQNSLRASKAFVKVNLGGISTPLFESEMFGHVRGAFTDARSDRMGRFEMAHKGTIFLDEIGDLDAVSQVKLLRVLQDRTYEILGSSRTKTVDVRVICATNRNLDEMVERGTFREDLLYRINLITVRLPALRERGSDIPKLVNFFIANLREIYNRPDLSVSKEALAWLRQLPLPGNIRQLKNLVERSALISRKDLLEVNDFQSQVQQSPARKGNIQLPEVGSISLDELEAQMIRRAMAFHRNKVSRAAHALGITRSSLYRRLEKHNIPFDEAAD